MKRHRSTNTLIAAPTFYEQAIDLGCAASSWANTGSSITGIRCGEFGYMDDVIVDNFRKRVSLGEVFFNPMERIQTVVSSSGGSGVMVQGKSPSCTTPLKYARYKYDGDELQYWVQKFRTDARFPEIPHVGLIDMAAISAGITQVSTDVASKRGRGDANFAESLAEGEQAFGLLGDAFSKLTGIVKGIKQRNPKLVLDAAASAYLLYRYGAKPLVSDVMSLMKALKSAALKVRTTSRSQVVLSDSRTVVEARGGGLCNRFIAYTANEKYTIRAMSLDEHLADFIDGIGLTGKNILTVPWELIPFSFVLDWFINVGDFIGAYAPDFGYRQLGSCLVIHRELNTEFFCPYCTDNASFSVLRPVTGQVSSRVDIKRRMPLASPGLVIKADFRFDKWTRACDAIALFYQVASPFLWPKKHRGFKKNWNYLGKIPRFTF